MSKIKWAAVSLVPLLVLVMATGGCSRKEERTPVAEAPVRASDAPGAAAATDADPAVSESGAQAGLPDVGAMPEPDDRPQVYVVKAGDTLSSIASRFDCTVQDLIKANQLANPNLLSIGQELQIPSTATEASPDLRLLPNSEFVNSPAYLNFDTGAFCARQGGYLVDYQENVDGTVLSGPEIVNLVAHRYSLGPRLLLAVVEHASGWVSNPNPGGAAVQAPLGNRGGGWGSFHVQLAWAADKLSEGYYDWRGRGMNLKLWGDGTATRYAPTLNAATAGLQYYYSLNSSKEQWKTLVGDGPGSFLETYRRMFGDPAQYAIEPLIRADTASPTLTLPWSEGEMWFYTGGPHGGWNDGSAWAAIDFVPDEGYLGCQAASSWATAAAPGLVIHSQQGEVLIDLDRDGHEETGWVLFYLHVGSRGRVPVGTTVKQGDPIGHPSCEGGFSESTHLHFARRYNGEWIAADGPLPLVLSGWQFASSGSSYDGTASRDDEERTACECRDAGLNGLTVDR